MRKPDFIYTNIEGYQDLLTKIQKEFGCDNWKWKEFPILSNMWSRISVHNASRLSEFFTDHGVRFLVAEVAHLPCSDEDVRRGKLYARTLSLLFCFDGKQVQHKDIVLKKLQERDVVGGQKWWAFENTILRKNYLHQGMIHLEKQYTKIFRE
jgi:hypothetical protein